MTKTSDQWLTPEQAEALIAPLMDHHGVNSQENDTIAKVLFQIIQLFAYEEDWVKRDADAVLLADAIYRHTFDFSRSCHRFAGKAGLNFGSSLPVPQRPPTMTQ